MKILAFGALLATTFLATTWLAVSAPAADFKLPITAGLDAYMPIPVENPLTPGKIRLGRELFFDKRLSRDETVACATCHDPDRAFTDDKPLAVGVFGRKGNRRVPTLVNRAYGKGFFWDGRIPTLEEQVVQPILNDKEMDMTLEEVVARLKSDDRYRTRFRETFGEGEINGEKVAWALASYVRTILSGSSPYDRYVLGDPDALSEEARRGLAIFRGKGNCTDCHLGPNLSDERFHNPGIAWRDGRLRDVGRYKITGIEKDNGAFKTPTLREVARKAPYMHDGSLATLEEVVEFYSRGGNRNPNLDPEILPLELTPAEKRSVVSFLQSLAGDLREGVPPQPAIKNR
jgi:cytochrome c peroxidase